MPTPRGGRARVFERAREAGRVWVEGVYRLGLWLLQLCVLGFGLLVDGNVGIGIFPEGEQVLICSFCSRSVALYDISTGELQVSQCAERIVSEDDAVIKDFLKLGGGLTPLVRS